MINGINGSNVDAIMSAAAEQNRVSLRTKIVRLAAGVATLAFGAAGIDAAANEPRVPVVDAGLPCNPDLGRVCTEDIIVDTETGSTFESNVTLVKGTLPPEVTTTTEQPTTTTEQPTTTTEQPTTTTEEPEVTTTTEQPTTTTEQPTTTTEQPTTTHPNTVPSTVAPTVPSTVAPTVPSTVAPSVPTTVTPTTVVPGEQSNDAPVTL